MYLLSDKTLLEAHEKAIELDLDEDFIFILEKEMNKRGLKTDFINNNKHQVLQNA